MRTNRIGRAAIERAFRQLGAVRRRAAIHEAGHAVMALREELGGTVVLTRVWIDPECMTDDGVAGRTEVRHGKRAARRIEVIDFSLGGYAAERIRYGRWNPVHAANDLRQAKEEAGADHAFLMDYRRVVRMILEMPGHWAAVEAIADRLVARGTVSGREARALYRKAMEQHR